MGDVMRSIFALAAIAGMTVSASAGDTYVNGYFRNDGTYVQPHYRSAPDSSTYNNYSTQGNQNPYTGQSGTRNPDYQAPSSGYGNYGSNYIGRR
jgi:hypothetical protein